MGSSKRSVSNDEKNLNKDMEQADNQSAKDRFRSNVIGAGTRILVFLLLIAFEELMFHFLSIGNDASFLPIKLVMCIPTAVVLGLLTMFLPNKAAKITEAVILGAVIFYYLVNVLYFSAFKVFFSIKLIDTTNAKIIQYYREIWDSIKLNSWKLALMTLIPVAIYVVLIKIKKIIYTRVSLKYCYIPILTFVLSVGAVFVVAYSYGKDSFAPYELIVGENLGDFSFPRLGVIATGEIELKNLLIPKKEEAEEFEVWHYEPMTASGNSTAMDGNPVGTVGAHNDNGDGTEADSGNGEANNGVINEESPRIIDTSPNILDIDFVMLAENEANGEISGIHRYFASVEPSYKNEYTGMFEGYNLIFMTCEAFCPLAVNEELTPTLYRLVNEGFVFNNFYNPRTYGSTSDGEFVCSTSLVPANAGATNFRIAGQNSMPFALGNMFNMEYGITSRAYHDSDYTYYDRDKTYPGMGYYYVGIGNGLQLSYSWPMSDLEMIQATVNDYIDDDLFNVYYMTVSGHKNYNFGGNAMSLKNREAVENLQYSNECKAYLACQMELDHALEFLISQLEEKGIADRTVICFTGDHWPYGLTNEQYSELLGHEVEPNFELFKSNLVLWSGSIKEPIQIDKQCGSMDILPTLLNLFGMPYDSRLLMGRDILSDTEGFVIFINQSFITDKVMYNSINGKVINLTDEELPEDYISKAKELLNNRWKYSQKIMNYNYYKYICESIGIEIPVIWQNYW